VTSHDTGVTVLTDDLAREINAVILPKNRPIPCDQTLAFQLAEPGQTEARIELLQGPAGADRRDCLVLGYFDLVGLPPVCGAPHPVEVRIKIDRNGILTASAHDTVSGKVAELSVDYRKASVAGAGTIGNSAPIVPVGSLVGPADNSTPSAPAVAVSAMPEPSR
jgi:molecular chaperone DnaK (HSP70)